MNGWLKVSPTASEWSMKEYLDRIPDEILPPQMSTRARAPKLGPKAPTGPLLEEGWWGVALGK